MKKILVTLFVLSLSIQHSFSQTHVVLVKKGDLWGYMGDNGEWGIINTSGDWVIEPSFEGIKDMERLN